MSILRTIVANTQSELNARRTLVPVSELIARPEIRRAGIPLKESILSHPPVGLIAEIKRASPSAGTIRNVIDPAAVASVYETAGAAAISVLTDSRYFGGSLDDLAAVRAAVDIPILRKDFIIDEYQVVEAKAYGADAILLIAAILDRNRLRDLYQAAAGLGLECLVELYDSHEIDILDCNKMRLIGINNRDLHDFIVDPGRTIRISRLLPAGVCVIGESGISSPAIVRQYAEAGISGILVGEHLMRSGDPAAGISELLGSTNRATAH